jgi:SM-20-related protein
MSEAGLDAISDEIKDPEAGHAYGYRYRSYPLVMAYLERWHPGSAHERLLEELNGADVLDLMREVTAIPEIIKMDGQATLYAPGDFLWPHSDAEGARGRRVAYVLSLTAEDWRPQWGGYLNFFSPAWDIERAIRPRFNSLNLFRVPQWHSVSEVTGGAPLARYAVTGWARDR